MIEVVVVEELVQYSVGSRREDDWEDYSRGLGHNGEKNDRLV
jgi:hypothetical protein